MDFMLNCPIPRLDPPIGYHDKVMLIGSCFTEHIGHSLADMKFRVMQNPHGILFGPDSVCASLMSYMEKREAAANDLFRLNEVWHHWRFHSRFSHTDAAKALEGMNRSVDEAHAFLKNADWLILTLGSSFTYRLTHMADTASLKPGDPVANCHRAPSAWFDKEMLETEAIKEKLEDCLRRLRAFNPDLRFIFTVSPVRHIRDGVVENNRSKARLLEAVHYIVTKFEPAYYFPAYELVIDVLRDYRFYDVDMVHPNYPATQYVLERFTESCLDTDAVPLMQQIRQLTIARKHKAFHPDTAQHRQFLAAHAAKARSLQEQYPFLDLAEEIAYFSSEG